ncbi:hypothetical protein AGMMS50212_01750 [Spirochaetia bacterium]|nr:hypothetical protein AGMMS50212_01750 [Spirochaetia bacterium]
MNEIYEKIKDEIQNRQTYFVFPTQNDARQWARKCCILCKTVPLNRFIAFDKFKEQIVSDPNHKKKNVTQELRLYYTYDFIRRNAEAVKAIEENKKPENGLPLRSIIPHRYAAQGTIFASSIAAFLPSLNYWESKMRFSSIEFDDEDNDYSVIKNDYNNFLNKNNYFESSWEKINIAGTEKKYIIFCPELIEEWTLYKHNLTGFESIIETVSLKAKQKTPALYLFDSSRAELRALILRIRALHEKKNIDFEDMALSVTGIETYEPYIQREFKLYNVPLHSHYGKPLADYEIGRFFSLISDCVNSRWTFDSVKALLCDAFIPWKDSAANHALVNFGVQNNCVCGYFKENKYIDVWEKSLQDERCYELHHYYTELKRKAAAIVKSAAFKELGVHFFDFRRTFFTVEVVSKETDAVLSRCIDELYSLIEIEKKFPNLKIESPFSFFLSLLKKKQYVPIRPEIGVNLFDYKIAAASPFNYHFILNVNQNNASVIYSPLKFINPEKRSLLKIDDIPAMADFFNSYSASSLMEDVYISAASHTFSLWSIPHSFFTGSTIKIDKLEEDSFSLEKSWWADGVVFPQTLFPVQKDGYQNWKRILQLKNNNNNLKDNTLYKKGIMDSENGSSLIKVSATDLNKFFTCPKSWFYERICKIEKTYMEARLADDAALGNVYHKILKDLFEYIKSKDSVFKSGNIEAYKSYAAAITKEYYTDKKNISTALIEPFFVPLTKKIIKTITEYLKVECAEFDNYAVDNLEYRISYEQYGMIFIGFIDRISISPLGEPLIVDYKSGKTPSKSSCIVDETGSLNDFQIAMYVKLYESASGKKIKYASFIDLRKKKPVFIIADDKYKKAIGREDFEKTLCALDNSSSIYRNSIVSADISDVGVTFKTCGDCIYKYICRHTYMLNKYERKNEE